MSSVTEVLKKMWKGWRFPNLISEKPFVKTLFTSHELKDKIGTDVRPKCIDFCSYLTVNTIYL